MVLCVMCYALSEHPVVLVWQEWCSDVKGAAEWCYVLCAIVTPQCIYMAV